MMTQGEHNQVVVMDKSRAGIYEIDSVTSEERKNGGSVFVTLERDHPSDGDGNFSVQKMFFSPTAAMLVGKLLIAHALLCGATDPETKGRAMPKRMTQRERNRVADELLCAAKHWQNNLTRCNKCRISASVKLTAESTIDWEQKFYHFWDVEASAALSEAARLADTELVDAKTGK